MIDNPVPDSAPDYITFCPRCATPMHTRQIGDKARRVCPECNYIHFTDPKVGVGVLVIDQGRVLLVRRAMMPEKGKWSIPAGFLDFGEDPRVTARREVWEETNLDVEIGDLIDVYHNPQATNQGGASIFILFQATIVDGKLEAGDDAEAAGFFGPDDLPVLAFESTRDAIRKWQQNCLNS